MFVVLERIAPGLRVWESVLVKSASEAHAPKGSFDVAVVDEELVRLRDEKAESHILVRGHANDKRVIEVFGDKLAYKSTVAAPEVTLQRVCNERSVGLPRSSYFDVGTNVFHEVRLPNGRSVVKNGRFLSRLQPYSILPEPSLKRQRISHERANSNISAQ
jgi:hypothetical protein